MIFTVIISDFKQNSFRRLRPTRIGLVFYQHKALIYPAHGSKVWAERSKVKLGKRNQFCILKYFIVKFLQFQEKHERDYLAWLQGKFLPSPKKLSLMKEVRTFLLNIIGLPQKYRPFLIAHEKIKTTITSVSQ